METRTDKQQVTIALVWAVLQSSYAQSIEDPEEMMDLLKDLNELLENLKLSLGQLPQCSPKFLIGTAATNPKFMDWLVNHANLNKSNEPETEALAVLHQLNQELS